jgi:hypothetical protein
MQFVLNGAIQKLTSLVNISMIKFYVDILNFEIIAEFSFSSQPFRITPIDVNSRPSSCLTSFILGSKTNLKQILIKKFYILNIE